MEDNSQPITSDLNIQQLQNLALKSTSLEFGIGVSVGDQDVALLVFCEPQPILSSGLYVRVKSAEESWASMSALSIKDGLQKIVAPLRATGTPKADTVVAKIKNPPGYKGISPKELKYLVTAAWYEAFNIKVPTEQELKKQLLAIKAASDLFRSQIVENLRTGSAGAVVLTVLNEQKRHDLRHLEGVDLSGTNLEDTRFRGLSCNKSTFDSARLDRAQLTNCELKQCSFVNARMDNVVLSKANCADADLTGASLTGARLYGAKLTNAKLHGADLSEAILFRADLRGADLSKCIFHNTNLEDALFDERTVVDDISLFSENAIWKGSGPDPRKVAQVMATSLSGASTFEEFVEGLKENIDHERIKKAIKMLKSERFQLYADMNETSLVGIVRSQTSTELVYSCRLTKDGQYSCCTQNLNICGGLRGSLCKHLLVLIIGLSKEQLDMNTLTHWVMASCTQRKPCLNKDIASETFLKFKGATAGELDWRPTETLPEDYYSL